MYVQIYRRSKILLTVALAVILTAGNCRVTVSAAKITRQYVVDPNGTGDFLTIQEGVDSASDGDTLLLYPGIYTEPVRVMNKELNIIGVSKDLCILKYDTASYRKAPLTIAAGNVSNITIYGINSNMMPEELTEEEIEIINAELVGDSWDRQKNYTGYAIHVDQNYLYGRSLSFDNCRIISENNHCAGIGSRGGSIISFENCELVSLGSGSCLYLHDPTSPDVSGEASLILRNCQMTSYLCPYVMTLQSLLPECNTMKLTFQNTHISAVAYADDESYVPINVNTGMDVETLSQLQQLGGQHTTGMSSSSFELVHVTQQEDARLYMEELESALAVGNVSKLMNIKLPEGITYLGEMDENAAGSLKHQVIAIYNRSSRPGFGWCGLDSAYLTADSYGNTLPEMNAADGTVSIPSTAAVASAGFPASAR
ncbi:MAG: hypothetical protein K2N73_07580 [Lachnospiraceae bacterium]|nr:hypothetical protein [Lachnospiraceae bacterium]